MYYYWSRQFENNDSLPEGRRSDVSFWTTSCYDVQVSLVQRIPLPQKGLYCMHAFQAASMDTVGGLVVLPCLCDTAPTPG